MSFEVNTSQLKEFISNKMPKYFVMRFFNATIALLPTVLQTQTIHVSPLNLVKQLIAQICPILRVTRPSLLLKSKVKFSFSWIEDAQKIQLK